MSKMIVSNDNKNEKQDWIRLGLFLMILKMKTKTDKDYGLTADRQHLCPMQAKDGYLTVNKVGGYLDHCCFL